MLEEYCKICTTYIADLEIVKKKGKKIDANRLVGPEILEYLL